MKLKLNAYQAKSGLIYLSSDGGRAYTALSSQQIEDLGIDVYSLDDFDLQLFKKAYEPPLKSSPDILLGHKDALPVFEDSD